DQGHPAMAARQRHRPGRRGGGARSETWRPGRRVRYHRTMRPAIRPLALAAMSALLLIGGCKESISDKAFGTKVRAYLLEHPEVLRETAEALDKKEALASSDKLGQAIRINRTALERD